MLGVWMWPESIRLRGSEAVFGACRKAGVTDVYFLTKGLAGTTAFLSPLAPPMEQDRDLLREALEESHKNGIRLHAWFTSASDANYKNKHPESGLCHYTKGRNRDIVSVTDRDYIVYMRSLLTDMIRRYDIDGVHFDYIRYNHLLFGWSDEDLKRYSESGIDIGHIRRLMDETFGDVDEKKEAIFDAFRSGDKDAVRLSEVRRENVVNFARALADTVRAENGNITVSAALMPEGAFDDLAFSDLHYGQNYNDLSHIMDMFLPMVYSQAYGKNAEWVSKAAEGTVRYGVPALIGVQAYEGGTGITLADDIEAAKKTEGIAGICLFREGAAVWTFIEGDTVSILNPLRSPVASCRFYRGNESFESNAQVVPLEEKEFRLPFTPDKVRAFSDGGDEVCVFKIIR